MILEFHCRAKIESVAIIVENDDPFLEKQLQRQMKSRKEEKYDEKKQVADDDRVWTIVVLIRKKRITVDDDLPWIIVAATRKKRTPVDDDLAWIIVVNIWMNLPERNDPKEPNPMKMASLLKKRIIARTDPVVESQIGLKVQRPIARAVGFLIDPPAATILGNWLPRALRPPFPHESVLIYQERIASVLIGVRQQLMVRNDLLAKPRWESLVNALVIVPLPLRSVGDVDPPCWMLPAPTIVDAQLALLWELVA